ncbi:hypothetical protein F4824DRAFT_453908 [Ustulina deusta]|nr:hypothetical protein F4823DRAFT_629541 [Ustulina deusta]KAI3340035.1 hypothetical protein F4824DRAFT_453908 [Ustulina deusta]
MLSKIATVSGLLAASLFAPSVEAKRMSPVRILPRADDYIWTLQWTGPKTCTSWPCGYSYTVSGPTYATAGGPIPLLDATCVGTVDQPLKACTLLSTPPGFAAATVSGNFSTYETSGVGSGLIDITATWLDQASGTTRTLTGVTPMQASTTNQNTWTVEPEGCPVTECDVVNATRPLRRGTIGIQI